MEQPTTLDLGFASLQITPYTGKPLLLQFNDGSYHFTDEGMEIIGEVEHTEPIPPTHATGGYPDDTGEALEWITDVGHVECLEMLARNRWRVRITEGVFEGGGAEVGYCHRRRKWYGFPTGRQWLECVQRHNAQQAGDVIS